MEIIYIGSAIFWICFAIVSTIIIASTSGSNSDDVSGFAMAALLASLAFIAFFSNVNIFSWIWQNSLLSVGIVALYFVIGLFWALYKWYRYNQKLKNVVVQLKDNYVTDDVSKNGFAFDEYVTSSPNYTATSYPPAVYEHKLQLFNYATYWPWSMFWAALSEPIVAVWRFMLNRLGGTLQRITNKIFEDV